MQLLYTDSGVVVVCRSDTTRRSCSTTASARSLLTRPWQPCLATSSSVRVRPDATAAVVLAEELFSPTVTAV
eukprot:3291816-Rhodomonas_salina.2